MGVVICFCLLADKCVALKVHPDLTLQCLWDSKTWGGRGVNRGKAGVGFHCMCVCVGVICCNGVNTELHHKVLFVQLLVKFEQHRFRTKIKNK